MGGEGPKKPKVLKRKGREVEEALLFEDQMDEAALEEWERKMGLRQEQDSKPPSQPVESPAPTEILQEPLAETKAKNKQADTQINPKSEPSWRQSGKLRWLGLAGVRLYLEEKGPLRKSLLLAGAASLAACILASALFFIAHGPGPLQEASKGEEPRQMLLDLIVPLKQGKAGLLLSVSLELEGMELQSFEVRKELFELISEMDPSQLLGEQGMKRLKASMAERLGARWPGLKSKEIMFLEYLIL